jgi:acid phosphatase (class A)
MRFSRAIFLAVFLLATGHLPAQQIETPPPPKGTPRPVPYLAADAVDYRVLLPSPPAVDSPRDAADRDAVELFQGRADAARWRVATDDSAYLYARFSEALGYPLERATLPLTVALLNRSLRDTSTPSFRAKEYFHRPRPFQRMRLSRVCGADTAPEPEENPTTGSSYPSGHAAYGWTVAMVLARVAPERASTLMARASEYAQSRIVCGVHFPTDIEAGRIIAVAVVDRLLASRQFQADLAAARAEYSRIALPIR